MAGSGRLRSIATASVGVVLFAIVLAASLLLHVDTRVGRRVAARLASNEASRALGGEIVVEPPRGLGLGRVECARVVLRDEDGEPLASADCVSAQLDKSTLARSLLSRAGPIRVRISRLTIAYADVLLDPPRLERALMPRSNGASEAPSTPARPVAVDLERIEIVHAWVHGKPGPAIDADVDGVEAALHAGEAGVDLDVGALTLRARDLLAGRDVVARASGWSSAPEGGEIEVAVTAEAAVEGGRTALLRTRLDGNRLEASLVVPPASQESPGGRAPRGAVSGRARVRGTLPDLEVSADGRIGGAAAIASGRISLAEPPRMELRARIDHVDLRALASNAPGSDLDVVADLDVAMAHGGPKGTLAFDVPRGTIAGNEAPLMRARASFDPRRADGTIVVEHRGGVARIAGRLDLTSSPPSGDARAVVSARHLKDVLPWLGVERGRVLAAATARFSLGARPRATGDADLSIQSLEVGPARIGDARVRASVRTGGGSPSGRIDVDATGMWIWRAGPARGHVDAKLDGHDVTLNAAAHVAQIGHAFLNSSTIHLAGPVERSRSWRDAVGVVQLDTEVDLERLARALPPEQLRLSESRGKVLVLAEIARGHAGEPPSLELFARTQGLVVAPQCGRRPLIGGTEIAANPQWRLAGVDVRLDARVDPNGAASARGDVFDRRGALVSIVAKGTVPIEALAAGREDALERWMDMPVGLDARMPERPLATLPALRGTRQVAGDVETEVSVHGTPRRPRVHADARLSCLRPAPHLPAADVELALDYDGGVVEARAVATNETGGRLSATGRVDTGVATLPEAVRRSPRRWTGRAALEADAFRIESLAAMTGEEVRGTVTGKVELTAPRGAPFLDADLHLDDVVVAGARYHAGSLRAELDAIALTATAELRQEAGFARASLEAPLRWRGRFHPELDPARRLEALAEARAFRIAAFTPLAGKEIVRLDGRLDADVKVVSGPGTSELSATASLERGILQLAALGEELTDIRARATLSPDGVVKVERVSARSLRGRMLAAASARIDGTDLVGARAIVRIPRETPMPLTLEGQGYGDVWGEARIDVTPDGDALRIDAWLDRIRVELLPRPPHDLQELAPAEHVRIGTYRAPARFVLLPLGPPEEHRPEDAQTFVVVLHLGDVEVRRGDDLRVALGGVPRFEIARATTGSGQIALEGGIFYVQGKRFEIQRGTVTFRGTELANPDVVVTAAWTAPDRTRVFADFVGPLETGQVTLRSEPPLSRDQILALILFGTPSGPPVAPEAPGTSGAEQAFVLGGGVAARGLNRAIDELTGLDVTARIDTGRGAAPRPEVEVRIAKDVSFQIAHVLGTPPPWSNPDKTFVTLEWRLGGSWSLETTVGDEGSSILDLIWQRTY